MPREIQGSYEEQQAELQRLQDGGKSEELQIEAPKEPEVNPEVYKDVEPYLFRGFLTQASEINGVEFVFKTLNHHEHELIRLSGGYDEKGQPSKRFWDKFLAYSVLMLDGSVILQDRDYWIPKISAMFKEFQSSSKTKIVRHLSELNRRATNAVTLTECYVMERYSRYRWYQIHGMDMTSTALTGIAGTERLGMNWGQLIWRALNRMEDIKDTIDHEWEHAKFIGSCSAGKGIQKVYQHDAERRRTERDEQISRKDLILRHVLLGEPLRKGSTLKSGTVWVTAQTVEDLADQLSKDLKGDKDLHDSVVDAFENRVKEARAVREQQIQEVQKQRDSDFHGKTLVGRTSMTGLTRAEVQERMTRRRQYENQAAAALLVPSGAPNETDASVGATSQDVSSVRPIPTANRNPGTPFRRG